MPYNRIRFGTKESTSLGVIVQRMQFAYEHRTLLYPAVKGLHCAFGCTAWFIEQSQFGLAIRMWLKETKFHHSCKFSKAFFDFIGTFRDINGHRRTLSDIALSVCIIFAWWFFEDHKMHTLITNPKTKAMPWTSGKNATCNSQLRLCFHFHFCDN